MKRKGLYLVWLVLALGCTFAWWNLSPHLFRSLSLPMGLGVQQGVPVVANLVLAWALRLLTARSSGPATVGIVLASVALPYALLAALLILGRIFS